ncbi:MAG TPA: hypothetical protein PKE04_10715, partial [Clostridia bacterium]|nr:hypothetical protein [Clostridia bacterium]
FPLAAESDRLKISVGAVRDSVYGIDAESSWFWKWVQQATGIDFEVVQVLDTAVAEKKTLMFATDDLPEILFGYGFTTDELVKYGMGEGQLLAMNADVNADVMPYLTAWFDLYPEAKAYC